MVEYTTVQRRQPAVELTIPAAGEFLSVVRTATAALGATADFVIDDIEDLRIAVDEACSILLARAIPGTDLTCAFYVRDGAVTIESTAHVLDRAAPPRTGFAWTVLTSLTSSVDMTVHPPDRLVVAMTRIGSKTEARS
ncbi:MAG: hypothetical protein L0K86_05095 [Actinomycetia bacterium]|nr:hypothetical protein [Actinomycetes bacterium]